MRLRRVSPNGSGWTRKRSGSGFSYLDQHGNRLAADDAQRVRDLVIPPAWQDVWISPYANGHIQAVGTDDAGRRQYRYHEQWQQQRAEDKFDRLLTVAQRLPKAREQVTKDLARDGMPRERALAAAFRMLDLGYFRVGGESYTLANGSYGLATLLKRHVRSHQGELIFSFVAKSGKDQEIHLRDAALNAVITELRRRRGGTDELLAYREGRRWLDVSSTDINGYVKDVIKADVSAKDFRTWHATVIAAIALSRMPTAETATAKKRKITAAVKEVSEYLGNTPTVARASYVDPRVIDRFEGGTTVEKALTKLGPNPDLDDEKGYASLERAVARMLRS